MEYWSWNGFSPDEGEEGHKEGQPKPIMCENAIRKPIEHAFKIPKTRILFLTSKEKVHVVKAKDVSGNTPPNPTPAQYPDNLNIFQSACIIFCCFCFILEALKSTEVDDFNL